MKEQIILLIAAYKKSIESIRLTLENMPHGSFTLETTIRCYDGFVNQIEAILKAEE
jgi:hypothetical protein